MYLVAIAWMYVVLTMSAAEAISPAGTLLGALFTFLLYGALPLAIVLYVLGAPGRRRRRAAASAATAGPAGAAAGALAAQPDGGGQPAGDAVAPEREEP